jgi:hypothetical protein
MSSTYLLLKNNNEHNASISVEASAHPIKEFGVSEFIYLTLIVLFINLFFKGVSMLLDFLKQRWVQRRNGKDGGGNTGVDTCDSSLKQVKKDA